MDFGYLHIYGDDFIPAEQMSCMSDDTRKIFPNLEVDVRTPFEQYWQVRSYGRLCEDAEIFDTRRPLDEQVKSEINTEPPPYDGLFLQRRLGDSIDEEERGIEHVHIILTNLLACTFDEDDWRYHARTVICGTPSIISLAGIVEGPAKPREFYYPDISGFADAARLKETFTGKFVDYGDIRIFAAALGYIVQAVFYFISDGDPFCKDKSCGLYNAHWQEEMIRAIIKQPRFCRTHKMMLRKFNASKGLW